MLAEHTSVHSGFLHIRHDFFDAVPRTTCQFSMLVYLIRHPDYWVLPLTVCIHQIRYSLVGTCPDLVNPAIPSIK